MKINMDYETLRNSMTVQDAVRVLKETNCCGTMDIAKTVIIKALEQQPNEDCISRKAVLDSLHSCFAEGFNEDRWWNSTHVLDTINEVPSVAPQQKTGHWIMTSNYLTTAYGSIDYVKCSCCGEDSLEEGDYCPNCGAKMQEVEK